MQIVLNEILELIDTKNSWGKDQLKLAILKLLAEKTVLRSDSL